MTYNLDSCTIIDFLRSNKPVTKKILEANDAVLITDNVKHFERVPNLKVVNWKDLG